MNKVCLTGVILLFFSQFIKYKSKAAFLIFLNGLLYYLNPKSKLLRFNDMFWNFILTLIVVYSTPASRKFMSLGILFWIINLNTKNNNYIHVLGVQLPVSLALNSYLTQ